MVAIITLLTDFGCHDGYVGIMKGVIAGVCPAARIIDLTHAIPPQNIMAARFTLLSAYTYFPQGTIHTVVVDPGVGTERRAIAIQTPTGYLVGPDNGVLSGVIDREGAIAAVSLTKPDYWRTKTPSATFHGRDIFAPVAAHLAAGISISDLGTAIELDSLVQIAMPKPIIAASTVTGHVQHIDQFGNIVTTIPAEMAHQGLGTLKIGAVEVPLRKTYGNVARGQALAVVGSHGWIEIAVNGSSAQQRFCLAIGDAVQLSAKQHDF